MLCNSPCHSCFYTSIMFNAQSSAPLKVIPNDLHQFFPHHRKASPPPNRFSPGVLFTTALCHCHHIVSPSPHCSLFCRVMLYVIHFFSLSLCTVHHGNERHYNPYQMIRAIAFGYRHHIVSLPLQQLTPLCGSHCYTRCQ